MSPAYQIDLTLRSASKKRAYRTEHPKANIVSIQTTPENHAKLTRSPKSEARGRQGC